MSKPHPQIHSDPNILCGKPVFKGTRISVDFIKERMTTGWTVTMIFEEYPHLTKEHLAAILPPPASSEYGR